LAESGEFWEVIPWSYRLEAGPIEWKKKKGKKYRKKGGKRRK
jgi:hypothetical protein